MHALIRNGAVEQLVTDTDGYDLSLYTVVPLPEGISPQEAIWNGTNLARRPRTAGELTRDSLVADQMYARLSSATPEQLEAWLASNVTTVAGARQVLKFVLLALRSLQDRKQL